MSSIDCAQSLFCTEIHGEERNEESKTNVTWEWQAEKPWAMSNGAGLYITLAHSWPHNSCELHSLHSSPQIFKQKRDCSQSMSSTIKFGCNVREQFFLYWLDCEEPFRMDLGTIYYSSFSIWIPWLSLSAFSLH